MASEKEGKLALIIFAVAIFLSYAIPYHIHPYRTFYHELVICLGLVGAMAYFVISRPAAIPSAGNEGDFSAPVPLAEVRLRLPALLVLPLGILALIILQALTGRIQPAAFIVVPVLYLLLLALSMVFGASLALDQARIERAITVFAFAHLLAALVSVVFQHVQILGLDATPMIMYMAKDAHVVMRPFANVAQPNQLALLYFFGLAAVWYFHYLGKLPAWVCYLLAVLILWGAVLTQSRIGWILVPLFFIYTLGKMMPRRAIGVAALMSLLILYALLTVCLPQISQAIGFAASSISEHVGGRSERTVLWQTAWRLATQHPWFGSGWFGYGQGQVEVAADFASSTYAEHAHNLPLNLAAELGFPASLLIMGGLAWWFYQTCFRSPKSPALQYICLCSFALAVHSMVEFPLWYAFVLLPYGVLMGMMHQMRWPAPGTVVKPAVVLAGFALACGVMAAVTLDYQRVVMGFKALRTTQNGYLTQEKFLQKPRLTLFPQFFEYFKLTRIKAQEGMSQEDINYVETWSKRFGFVHIINLQAEVYVLNGQPAKAAHTMLTLQRLHPIPYPEYYDYWQAKAAQDPRYQAVFVTMPPRDSP